jgi:hypothetical protein
LQIILAKGRAFPSAEVRTVASCGWKVPAHSAGPTLRILTVFPFQHGTLPMKPEQNFSEQSFNHSLDQIATKFQEWHFI